jgi:hypothetical protein
MMNINNEKVKDLEKIENRVLGLTSPISVISRSELTPVEGRVVVCTSKLNGVKFLLKYNAWGFVRIQKEPTFFALYVSRPLSRISYFGEIKDIVYPEDSDSPITKEEASQYENYSEGKKIIVLKSKSLRRLKQGIPKGPLKRIPQGMRYTNFTKFLNARTTDDL